MSECERQAFDKNAKIQLSNLFMHNLKHSSWWNQTFSTKTEKELDERDKKNNPQIRIIVFLNILHFNFGITHHLFRMHNLMLCDIHAKLLMIFLVRFAVVLFLEGWACRHHAAMLSKLHEINRNSSYFWQ